MKLSEEKATQFLSRHIDYLLSGIQHLILIKDRDGASALIFALYPLLQTAYTMFPEKKMVLDMIQKNISTTWTVDISRITEIKKEKQKRDQQQTLFNRVTTIPTIEEGAWKQR